MRAALMIALFLIAHPVRAQDNLASAREVIQQQAEAFERDDAAAAYGFASPSVQTIFPQADSFMAMVRSGYAPVYRHKRFAFTEGGMSGGVITQRVDIVDADGVAWQALYTLEQQADGSMKISGCTLVRTGQEV